MNIGIISDGDWWGLNEVVKDVNNMTNILGIIFFIFLILILVFYNLIEFGILYFN